MGVWCDCWRGWCWLNSCKLLWCGELSHSCGMRQLLPAAPFLKGFNFSPSAGSGQMPGRWCWWILAVDQSLCPCDAAADAEHLTHPAGASSGLELFQGALLIEAQLPMYYFLYSFCNKITAQQMKMLILAYFVFIQVHKWNRFSHFLVVGMLGCSGALAKLGVWFQPFMLSAWVTVQKSQVPPGPLQLQELKLSQVRGNPGPKHWHAFTPLISNTPTSKNHLQFKWI